MEGISACRNTIHAITAELERVSSNAEVARASASNALTSFLEALAAPSESNEVG